MVVDMLGFLDGFAALGTGQLLVTDSAINSASYQKVLQDNVKPSVQE